MAAARRIGRYGRLVLGLAAFAAAGAARAGDSAVALFDEPSARAVLETASPSGLRARRAIVRADPGRIGPGDALDLHLFPDFRRRAVADRVSETAGGTRLIRARLEEPAAVALFTVTGGRLLGAIECPGEARKFIVRPASVPGEHVIEEVDPLREDILPPGPPVPIPARAGAPDAARAPLDSSTNTVVDVMMVYTPAARAWADTYAGGIQNAIGQAMQYAQTAADNSNVAITFNLVHAAEVTYTESGSSLTDLSRLQSATDGYMDAIHSWRSTVGADLVSLVTKVDDVGGLGYQLTNAGGEPDWAFCLTRVQQLYNSYTHVHEMGHNMGCHHRTDQADYPGPGVFSYSAGWRWLGTNGTRYASVMSYTENWAGQPVYSVGYFSSPLIQYQGVPAGNSVTGDNARSLRQMKTVIAGYRSSVRRIIRLTGSLDFGEVTAGQSAERTLTLHNDGSNTLTVSGLGFPAGYTGAWSGTLGYTHSTNIIVTFAPTGTAYYYGSVVVHSDATGGTNTRTLVGLGRAADYFQLSVTDPAEAVTVVPNAVTSATLQGRAFAPLSGHLRWTNEYSGAAGATAAAAQWTIEGIALNVGTNVLAVQGTNQPPGPAIAADAATNAPYNDGWQTGDDGGSGFAVWALTNYGANAGFFKATSGVNTNLKIDAAAWGLWANSGDTAVGLRPFAQPLATGDTVRLKFQNLWIENDRSVGFALQNAAGEYLFEFMFIGGRSHYTINDQSGGWNTSLAYTDAGLDLAFDVTGPDTYRLRSGATTMTGVLKARTNMVMDRFRAWNYSAGPGDNYNFYLTDLAITNKPAAGGVTSAVVWIVREPALAQPPFIVEHPGDQSVFVGEAAALSVSATGDAPLLYQWRQGDADRPGATNPLIEWASVQWDDAGAYRCVVSNAAGAVTSEVAALDVSELALDGSLAIDPEGRVMTWSGLTDRVYDVFWSTNLLDGFVPLATNLPALPVLNIFTDAVHEAEPRGFYHLRSRPVD